MIDYLKSYLGAQKDEESTNDVIAQRLDLLYPRQNFQIKHVYSLNDFPALNLKGLCKKCKAPAAQIVTQFVQQETTILPSYSETPSVAYVFPEHMLRTCGRCSYSWKEATADIEEQQDYVKRSATPPSE